MAEALYRKYRPQSFADVINQEAIKTILSNAVKTGRISHAYLFTGPRGVGKTTIARILAKAINCTSLVEGEPCTNCDNCKQVQEGRFLDLLEIDAASYTGVDNIRDIIDHVKFAPSRGKYKVFIIDEVHMLSKAAFNALLKTLEEPPAHAVFILATTEINKVPATIISRSQRFDFKRVSEADILGLLTSVTKDIKSEISKEALELVARAGDGSFRDGLSILDQVLSFASEKISVEDVEEILGVTRIETTQEFLDLLIAKDAAQAVKFVKELVSEGRDTVLFVKNFLEYLRLVLFVKMGVDSGHDLGITVEAKERLVSESKSLGSRDLLVLVKTFLEAYREAKTSPVQELPVLSAILTVAPNLDPQPTTVSTTEQQEPEAEQSSKPSESSREPLTNLHLGIVVERWAEVLTKIKDYNHSLLSSLRLGRLVSLDGLDLTLAFPYNFHKETIEARKNKIVVEEVLSDTFGQKIRIKVYLEKELGTIPETPKNTGDLLQEALKVLGSNDK